MRGPDLPSRHDGVTMNCPACGSAFRPAGRRAWCSDACRAAAYRRRRGAVRPDVVVPSRPSRVSTSVYECDDCGTRAVGRQRCGDCSTFMRRIGTGGACPSCDEAITVADLIGQEVGH